MDNANLSPPTTQPLYLLDTNILLAYLRFGPLGHFIRAAYGLDTVRPAPIISVVTEGEIRALALKRGWGEARMADMERLLSLLLVVPLPFANIVDAYARIDAHCEQHGLTLSKSDLWIAATAQVTGATLLTTDKDFDPLHNVFLQRDWIDPATR